MLTLRDEHKEEPLSLLDTCEKVDGTGSVVGRGGADGAARVLGRR